MPSSYAPIPLPNRGSTSSSYAACQPAFSAPVRWTLVVLSWLAFGIASYLAYHSATGGSVAGCGVGETNGCDIVLSSSWSKLLGVPVAVLGLVCYATLATLSVLLCWRVATVNWWITNAFVALAIVAAGASLWFVGIQVFAIGDYCRFCLVTDACGILIGVFALAAAVQSVLSHQASPQPRTLQPGLMALRTATTPSAARVSSVVPATMPSFPPSLAVAFAGAIPLLVLLIGGQLLFRGKTHHVEQVALSTPINMDDTAGGNSSDSTGGKEHTALRVPAPLEGSEPSTTDTPGAGGNAGPAANVPPSNTNETGASAAGSPPKNDADPKPDAPPAVPPRERIVTLLGGKFTLNTYQHPIIGSPEAPHIVVELVSYDCPHCRKMNALMHKALERYGDDVALILMPVPLEKDCNKLIKEESASHIGACGTARRACGVARLNPAVFAKFHDFLMSGGDKPPTTEQIVPKANGLVDREQLRQLIGSPEVKKQIEGYVDLYGQLQSQSRDPNKFGLPVQILGDKVLNGSVEKVEDVYKAWEQHLGVKPK